MKKLKYHSQVMLLLIALLLLFFTQAGTDESNDIDVKYEFQETTITLC